MAKRKSFFSKNKPMSLAVVIFALIVGLPIAYYFYNGKSFSPKYKGEFLSQFPMGYSTQGIDISHHQGEMDWELLYNELRYDTLVHFVYCKATESLKHVDTQWERNRKELTKLDVAHGAYHFFDGKNPPREQAQHFLSQWSHQENDLAPMLDVETEGFSDQDLIAKMKIWLNVVEKETGLRPIIYCSNHYFETKFKFDFKDYNFWIAAYSRIPTSFSDPRVLYWQFSETGQMPGTKELVDLNIGK